MKGIRGNARLVHMGNRRIIAKGVTGFGLSDFYHRAMTGSWTGFFLASALVFAVFNAAFAGLYLVFPDSIANVPPDKPWHVLFFSIETLATVGYGDMHPQSEWGHFIASLETFAGVVLTAILTGLIFARFSRPTARLIFSKNIIIGAFEGSTYLMIRVANARANFISDAVARLWMLETIETVEGRNFRRFLELPLERVENPSFVLSWTIFHRIGPSSPLYGRTPTEMEAAETGFILSITGTDEGIAQSLRARRSYDWRDIVEGAQFADLLENDEEGRLVLDYGRFDELEEEAG